MYISGNLENIPTLLRRKKCKPRKSVRNVLRTSFSVNSVGLKEFYGFEVNKDHLFLLSNFTVVHNSTMAAGVFCLLKMHGIKCELVTEFAKGLVWEERYKTLKNQQYIFGKQYHKIWRVLNQVDVILTDSPLMLSIIYAPVDYPNSFTENVIDTINTLNNLNILLNRQKEYNNDGRYQTEEQAKIIDKNIKQKLFLYDMRWVEFYADFNSINKIVQLILTKINGSEFNRSDLNFYVETNL